MYVCTMLALYIVVISEVIMNYNASAVKVYNATSSLVRLEDKNVFSCFEKCSTLVQCWRCM
jgi:hypothetical protein